MNCRRRIHHDQGVSPHFADPRGTIRQTNESGPDAALTVAGTWPEPLDWRGADVERDRTAPVLGDPGDDGLVAAVGNALAHHVADEHVRHGGTVERYDDVHLR